jgi:hypothetical protein
MSGAPSQRRQATQPPQKTISQYWRTFNSPYPGKAFSILPPRRSVTGSTTSARSRSTQRYVPKTYQQARAECERDVDRIIKECRRTNQKYRDLHFDIELDLKSHTRDCLKNLKNSGDSLQPKGVKRVTDIFEKPQFYVNGPTATDVKQGRDGDCYLMAALSGLGCMEGLIEKVAVKHDVQVGVYGFLFYRDGEWQQTIIDDKLYLRLPNWEEALEERNVWEEIDRPNSEEDYRRTHQTGSRALYFAQCTDQNETWLPLLEKAFAKAHGDFAAIDGGWTGEALEDLTGGVCTEISSIDILDKDKFWTDELMKVGKDFLFGCSTGFYDDWLEEVARAKNDKAVALRNTDRRGVVSGHAYSIIKAVELKGQRLLQIRNPWGKREWTGKWSDGSEQWNAEWINLLGHKFGNDGVFWISYEDLLARYSHFDRTRIFSDDWSTKQCWTTVDVGWEPDYHPTKFELVLKERSKVVIALSQLDCDYWHGLEGEYDFELQFRLERADSKAGEYVVRSNGSTYMIRSVSTDLELPAGTYVVRMRIKATSSGSEPLEDLIPRYVRERREKFYQIGQSYELAHQKGLYVETKAERKMREKKEKGQFRQEKEEARAAEKKRRRHLAEKMWQKDKKLHQRNKLRTKKKDEIKKLREERDLARAERQRPAIYEVSVPDLLIVEDASLSDSTVLLPQTSAVVSVITESTELSRPATPTADQSKSKLGGEPSKREEVPLVSESSSSTTDVNSSDREDILQPDQCLLDQAGHLLSKHLSTQLQSTSYTGEQSRREAKPLSEPTLPEGASRNNDDEADEVCSLDSFPAFDWDSELDMTSDSSLASSSDSSHSDTDSQASASDDDSDSDSDALAYRPSMYRPPPPIRSHQSRRKSRSSGHHLRDDAQPPPQDAVAPDPRKGDGLWNAVCTVGMRVYSTLSDDQVQLRVLWPEVEEQERWEKKMEKKKARREAKKERHGKSKGKGTGDNSDKSGPVADIPGGVVDQNNMDPDDINRGAVLLNGVACTA